MLESICALLSSTAPASPPAITAIITARLLDDTCLVCGAMRTVRALPHVLVLGSGLRQCAVAMSAVHQLRSLRASGEWAGVGGGEKIVFWHILAPAPLRLPRRGDQRVPQPRLEQ